MTITAEETEKLRGTLVRLARARDAVNIEAAGKIGATVAELVVLDNDAFRDFGAELLLLVERLRDLQLFASADVRRAARAALRRIERAASSAADHNEQHGAHAPDGD